MNTRQVAGLLLTVVALVALSVAGCDDNDSLAPFEPEIVSNADKFEFQATGLTGVTDTITYTWQNSSTGAIVDHSSAVTGGSTRVVIFDDADTQVYSSALKPSAQENTSTGQAGAWRIRVELVDTEGTLNFRVQKQ